MIKLLMLLLLCSPVIWSQGFNVKFFSNIDPYPTRDYNDIWGYVDPQGREYALLGVEHGTSIINVTNPEQPVEIAFIPGPVSTWRDIKTHSHYAYVVTEGTGTGQGLQVIDLSALPTTATLVNTISTWFSRAHNLYIDNGYAYVVGTNNGGGMHVIDLTNPVNPVRTAYYTASAYIHDVYVWNDTAYASAEGTYDIVSLLNKNNPVKINSSAALPGIYAHSGWLTEDKRYFIACEEFNVRDVTVWDLQNRTWDLIVSQWQMTGNSPVHNIFVKGDYAHISYYKDGYVVLDISNPFSPVLAGQYDTYPGTSGTYRGAWGVYPYFPSGNIIVSDIQTGLWVFDFLLDDPVPVELNSFSAEVIHSGVLLNWSTSTETNNYGFELERRQLHSETRTVVSFIPGYGTTTERREYSYTDRLLNQPGKYYYRLKQIDLDGTFSYSDEIEVNFILPEEFILNQNYPNPFNPSTTIEFLNGKPGHVKLEVYNSLGEKVEVLLNQTVEQGYHKIVFNGSSLPSGIYFARLESGTGVQTIKMSLMK